MLNPNNYLNIVSFILSFMLFRFLGIGGLIFIAAVYLGFWIAKWYCSKNKTKENILNLISYSNLLTWFLPPLGLFTASLAYGFSNHSNSSSNDKFRNLAIIGYTASIVNAAIGVIQRL